jgi:alanine racemase
MRGAEPLAVTGADAAGLVLTIDLGALARNWSHLAKLAPTAECSAVVKADAYGLGIEAAVPALWAAGCRTFFVAVPQEGLHVRQAAPESTIYILNSFAPAWGEVCRKHALRPVLGSVPAIEAWATHAPGEPSAIQVDTGMNRLGLSVHAARSVQRDPQGISATAGVARQLGRYLSRRRSTFRLGAPGNRALRSRVHP